MGPGGLFQWVDRWSKTWLRPTTHFMGLPCTEEMKFPTAESSSLNSVKPTLRKNIKPGIITVVKSSHPKRDSAKSSILLFPLENSALTAFEGEAHLFGGLGWLLSSTSPLLSSFPASWCSPSSSWLSSPLRAEGVRAELPQGSRLQTTGCNRKPDRDDSPSRFENWITFIT